MKPTQIIWIDDKTSEVQNIVNKMFRPLWEKNIRSNIYIVAEDKDYNKKIENDIENLNEIIVQVFVNYLISKGWINDKRGDKLYPLINLENDVNSSSFIPQSDVVTNKSKIFDELKLLIQKKHKTDLTSILNAEKGFEKERIIMIDMCLSQADFLNLAKEEDNLILSMYLYNYFKCNGYSTYMYTTFTNPTDLINTWRRIYKKKFNGDVIKFFNRSGEDADNIKGDNLLKYIFRDVKIQNDTKNFRSTNNKNV